MENATKGLLIVAAVLIAIVIISLGIRLLSSTGETTESAKKTGDALNEATGNASESAIDKILGLSGEDNDEISFSINRSYYQSRKKYDLVWIC